MSAEHYQRWYAAYTRHQHEKCVASSVSGKGIEAFLPLYNVRSFWADRVKTIQKPLFPCYLFVRMALEGRLAVLQTAGVHFLLGTSDGPVPIPDHEIDSIRCAVNGRLLVEPFPFLNAGDWVRVSSGPLAGVEGILVRKARGDRLVLSVEMLQSSVAVEIDGYHVERIGAGRGTFFRPSPTEMREAPPS
jgi:transcription antitermination factor NusG